MASITATPFLIHNKNEHFITGKSALPFGLKTDPHGLRYSLILALGLLVVGASIVLYGVYDYGQTAMTSSPSAAVTGWVVGRDESEGENPTYGLTYRFLVGDETFLATQTVSREVYLSHLPGQAIDITITTESPYASQIGTLKTPLILPWLALAGMILVTVAGTVSYVLYARIHEYQNLFQRGQVITGEIIAVLDEDLLNNRYAIEVHARFFTPDTSAVIEGKRRCEVDALKITSLPQVGASLRVLYLTPTVWEIL